MVPIAKEVITMGSGNPVGCRVVRVHERTGSTPARARCKTPQYKEENMERLTTRHNGVAVIKDKSKHKEAMEKLAYYEETREWIPVEERLPENDKYILLSFENFSIPAVGRYEADEEGGAFYVGDDDGNCSSYGLFVNAWMPMIEPYRAEMEE